MRKRTAGKLWEAHLTCQRPGWECWECSGLDLQLLFCPVLFLYKGHTVRTKQTACYVTMGCRFQTVSGIDSGVPPHPIPNWWKGGGHGTRLPQTRSEHRFPFGGTQPASLQGSSVGDEAVAGRSDANLLLPGSICKMRRMSQRIQRAFKLLDKCLLGQSSSEYLVLIEYLSPSEITDAPKERTWQLWWLMTVIILLPGKAPHPNSYQAIVVLGLELYPSNNVNPNRAFLRDAVR